MQICRVSGVLSSPAGRAFARRTLTKDANADAPRARHTQKYAKLHALSNKKSYDVMRA
jgi:hypothetical protein